MFIKSQGTILCLFLTTMVLSTFACKKTEQGMDMLETTMMLEAAGLTNLLSSGTGTTTGSTAGPGVSLSQQVELTAGAEFSSAYSMDTVTAFSRQAVRAAADVCIEVTLLDTDGVEVFYARYCGGSFSFSYTPTGSGVYTLIIKNNSTVTIALNRTSESGGDFLGTAEDANSLAKYSDVTFKVFSSFNKECYNYADSSMVPAGTDQYYTSVLAFLGDVQTDGTVADRSNATITLSNGSETLTLITMLQDFANSNPTATAEQLSQVANFYKFLYAGYIAGAGEMYVVPGIFDYTSNCADRATMTLSDTDPGSVDLQISISDTTGATVIEDSYPLKASLAAELSLANWSGPSTPYSCYYNADGDAVQSVYDSTTGVYSVEPCPTVSLANPPQLDAVLPSSNGSPAGSDPTKAFFFGSSMNKGFSLIGQQIQQALSSGEQLGVYQLEGCFYNGGLVGVPISDSGAYLPLSSFSASVGDIILVSGNSGVSTGLMDFYQGLISLDGEIVYPYSYYDDGVYSYVDVTIGISGCSLAADSGVATAGITDSASSYLYFSGVVTD